MRTPDHARATLEEFIEHWQRWDFGVWTVLLPGGEVIRHAGVQHTTIGDSPEVEVLWFIHPDYWNRGYATEMAREAVRVAFGVLELDEVVAFVQGSADCLRRVGPGWETGIDPPGGAFRCIGPRLSAPRSSRSWPSCWEPVARPPRPIMW